MTYEFEKERTAFFSSMIKESGNDWAIKVTKQLEDGDDLRRPNGYISNIPISNFEEITFNIQKCKSKQVKKVIPHDSNYYLQPLSKDSNPVIKSSNENEISDDTFL